VNVGIVGAGFFGGALPAQLLPPREVKRSLPMAGRSSRACPAYPEVVGVLVRYVRITCLGCGLLEAPRYATFCMTGIHRPPISAGLGACRTWATAFAAGGSIHPLGRPDRG
jgi:hypothetical protein